MRQALATLVLLTACGQASSPAATTAAPTVAASDSEAWRTRAADYLDHRVEAWLTDPPRVANVACALNCHTTFPAVLAQSRLPTGRTPHIDQARQRFEARLEGDSLPFYGEGNDTKARESRATEAVLVAAALSFDPTTRHSSTEAMNRMWSNQSEDGSWPWLDFGLEPWEHDGAFGVAIAALAAGPGSSPGTDGVRSLQMRARALADSASLHDRAGLLWASSRFEGLLTDAQVDAVVRNLEDAQDSDGGVALGRLLGERDSDADGYATAWVTLALCTSDNAPDAVRAGQAWLRDHQRRDGSWPGRSVNSSSRTARQYMTDAATAYAVLALDCT